MDRRTMIAGAAALAATPALPMGVALTDALPDPVFAAIKEHAAVFAAFDRHCGAIDNVAAELEGRTVTEADELAWKTAADAETDAVDRLVATVPKTPEGARAYLGYLAAYSSRGHEVCLTEVAATLLKSFLLKAA